MRQELDQVGTTSMTSIISMLTMSTVYVVTFTIYR